MKNVDVVVIGGGAGRYFGSALCKTSRGENIAD